MELNFTNEELGKFFSMYQEIVAKAEAILGDYIKANHPDIAHCIGVLEFEGIDIRPDFDPAYPVFTEEDTVNFSGDEYWAHGGHEYHEISMPLSLLFADDADSLIKEQAAETQAKIEEAKRAHLEKQRAEDEAQLAYLKKKLGR